MDEGWKGVLWALSKHFIHLHIFWIYRKFQTKAEKSVINLYIAISQLQQLSIHAQSCFTYTLTCSLYPWIILKHILTLYKFIWKCLSMCTSKQKILLRPNYNSYHNKYRSTQSKSLKSYVFNLFFTFYFSVFSRAAPTAYGGSQARGLNRAVATSLHHSHSNMGPHLQPTPQLSAMLDP